MFTILDLTAQIVSAHASSVQMTSDELLKELQKVYASLQALEVGSIPLAEEVKPGLTLKQAFKKHEVSRKSPFLTGPYSGWRPQF